MTRQLAGSVALVTGGAAGIGRATALAFAEQGAKVALADVAGPRGREVAQAIESAGGRAIFVETDVRDAGDVARMLAATVGAFGRLDCAFNNAGIEGTMAGIADLTEEEFDRTMAVNLRGTWLCLRQELQQMREQGGAGAIVNMSSVAGLVGFREAAAYVASKHAILGLTKSAALEHAAQGIRINAVCPGVIHTEMIDRVTGRDSAAEAQLTALEPMGRMGRPEEVAAAVVWLCSQEASFVTGHALVVDGGFIAP